MKRFVSGFILVLFVSSIGIAYQASIAVPNGTGAQVRSNMNNALQAITTKQSSNSSPSTTYAYMSWVDTSTTPPVWKIRNGANTAWISIGSLNDSGSAFISTNSAVTPWSGVTNKPTTVSGYGITDAITTANIGFQHVTSATNAEKLGGKSFYLKTYGDLHLTSGQVQSISLGPSGNKYYLYSVYNTSMPFVDVIQAYCEVGTCAYIVKTSTVDNLIVANYTNYTRDYHYTVHKME